MACSGQKSTHTPQPSQPISSTTNSGLMAENRHMSMQVPQPVQRCGSITATPAALKIGSLLNLGMHQQMKIRCIHVCIAQHATGRQGGKRCGQAGLAGAFLFHSG